MSSNQQTPPIYRFAAGGYGRCPGLRYSLQPVSQTDQADIAIASSKGLLLSRTGSPALSPITRRDTLPISQPVDVSQQCQCQRPQCLILCASCGYTFTGRVRRPCTVHPGQIYLMDNESCPGCRSSCLKEYNTC